MKKLASVLAMAGLGLVISGCSWLPFFGGGGGGSDMAKMMKDSAQAAPKYVLKGANVGDYAIWEASGMKMWWGCTGEKDGMKVIENRMEISGQGWITYAYVVDDEGNTKQAFVANYNPEPKEGDELEEGHEIKIAEPMEAKGGEKIESETGDETINAAGKDWDCTWTKTEYGKTWMPKDGWGIGMSLIKSEDAGGKTTMQLVEVGSDATLGLKFPGEGESKE